MVGLVVTGRIVVVLLLTSESSPRNKKVVRSQIGKLGRRAWAAPG